LLELISDMSISVDSCCTQMMDEYDERNLIGCTQNVLAVKVTAIDLMNISIIIFPRNLVVESSNLPKIRIFRAAKNQKSIKNEKFI